MLDVFEDEEFHKGDKKKIQGILESSFLFAAIWSLCITVTTDFRRPFDKIFKEIVAGSMEGQQVKLKHKISPSVFDKGTIYDYCYQPDLDSWKTWNDFVNKDELDQFPKDAIPNEIVVTTPDKVKYCYMLELLMCQEKPQPIMMVGPTGTGKTKYIMNVIEKLPDDKWLKIDVGFSAQTGCNQVQDIIDGKLTKLRKDHFGPRVGMQCVVFVDDLNMPKVEKYGAQPPIEILRQWIDQGGWYDRRDNKHPFRHLEKMNMVTAMGPPGGGRAFITPRMSRHFNCIGYVNLDETTLEIIFRNILKWHFRKGDFNSEVSGLEHKIVKATNKVFEKIQADMKPTPAKTHYTFNLRDFSKVICGMTAPTKKELTSASSVIRLWAHEACRVFGDRLINNEDRKWMMTTIEECFQQPFN